MSAPVYPSGRPRAYRPGPPTVEQLLVLVDRAESGLTAAEAARLREGIRAMAAAQARVVALAERLESGPGQPVRRYTIAARIRTAVQPHRTTIAREAA